MPYFGGYGGGGYGAQPVGNPMYQGGPFGGGGSLQDLLAMLRGAQSGGQGPAYGNDGRPRQLPPQDIPYGNDTIAKPIGNSVGGGQPGMFPSPQPFEGSGGLTLGMPNRLGGGQPGMRQPQLGMYPGGGMDLMARDPMAAGYGSSAMQPAGNSQMGPGQNAPLRVSLPGRGDQMLRPDWMGPARQNTIRGGRPGMFPSQGGSAMGSRPPETMGLNGGSNFASGRPSLFMSRPQFESPIDANPNRIVANNRQKKQAPGGRGDRLRPRGVTAYM